MGRLFRDPRDFQILFLDLFLFLGAWGRDWTLRSDLMLVATLTCLLTQFVGDRLVQSSRPSLRSAVITALSLCLLLRANSFFTVILAGIFSIASKFLFRIRGKHFFNPSNLGIIAALTLTSDAWVTPGQWGNEVWYALLFLMTGGMIVRKVGRWDTTGAFLGVYAMLELMRNLWLGWTFDVFLHKMMSGSLLLFSFFMITDPRAIPDQKLARIFWAVVVALVTFVLRNKFFLPTAPFWALFFLSPLTILLDRIWPAQRFHWTGQERVPPRKLSVQIQEVLP